MRRRKKREDVPQITYQEQSVTTPGQTASRGGAVHDEDTGVVSWVGITPQAWIRRQMPCPKCLLVWTPDIGQVVYCRSTHATLAYFRCRNPECGHSFKLPVKTC